MVLIYFIYIYGKRKPYNMILSIKVAIREVSNIKIIPHWVIIYNICLYVGENVTITNSKYIQCPHQ